MQQINMPMLSSYRLIFQALSPMLLSEYSGSAWRGLLGHGLRRVSCVTRAKTCDGCALLDSCVYASIFESRSSNGSAGQFQAKPHPFVLTVLESGRRQIKEDEYLGLEITLVGKANAALPYLIQGMTEGGKLGMGREHAQFKLAGILQEATLGSGQWLEVYDPEEGKLNLAQMTTVEIPAAPEAVDIELLTPLRMKRKGKLVGPGEFQAADFFRQLWRRTQDINHFYGDGKTGIALPLPQSRADSLDTLAQLSLSWKDWTRYSSRQRTAMQMGGVVGSIHLQGEALQEWWPLLWIGQWLHLGKATSMGLGQYRLSVPQACEQQVERQIA